MQSEEQRLIDGLFSRLKEAEAHSASRDASAEERIAQHVSGSRRPLLWRKPFLSEAAIKQLNDRIRALESQVSQLQAAKPSSGGFSPACLAVAARHAVLTLSRARSNMVARRPALSRSIRHHRSRTMPAGAARGGGFMAGALQTAAGVAGGVVLGNMLTNMFSGSHPQEIVNIIEEKPQPDAASAQDIQHRATPPQVTIRSAGDDRSLPTIPNDDFDAGFGDDDFGSDDDSWV